MKFLTLNRWISTWEDILSEYPCTNCNGEGCSECDRGLVTYQKQYEKFKNIDILKLKLNGLYS
jgi:hypothetical protein